MGYEYDQWVSDGDIRENAPTRVMRTELPFHCPPKDAPKWNMHPKVFLSFSDNGKASCPYCGAKYELSDRLVPRRYSDPRVGSGIVKEDESLIASILEEEAQDEILSSTGKNAYINKENTVSKIDAIKRQACHDKEK